MSHYAFNKNLQAFTMLFSKKQSKMHWCKKCGFSKQLFTIKKLAAAMRKTQIKR